MIQLKIKKVLKEYWRQNEFNQPNSVDQPNPDEQEK